MTAKRGKIYGTKSQRMKANQISSNILSIYRLLRTVQLGSHFFSVSFVISFGITTVSTVFQLVISKNGLG